MEFDTEEHRPAYDLLLEEEYIDMDVSSTAYLYYTAGSPPHSIDFEFHMTSNPLEREAITSPADELFYKGNLLPLHLPPRLQMVQRLLDNPGTSLHHDEGSVSPTAGNTTPSTPFQSCNISPVSSCYVSGELNPEEYYECSAGFEHPLPKKTWKEKLKQIRQTSLGLKLKASREYLKSLFTGSAACAEEPHAVRRAREFAGSNAKAGKKNPFGLIRWEKHQVAGTPTKSMDKEKKVEEECAQRRSFSAVIKHHLVNNSSTSSSSSSCCSSSSSSSSSSSCIASSNGHHGPAMLKRSSSANSEVECSIQGAIAYCKKSHQSTCARKSFSDVGCCALSPSKVAAACET